MGLCSSVGPAGRIFFARLCHYFFVVRLICFFCAAVSAASTDKGSTAGCSWLHLHDLHILKEIGDDILGLFTAFCQSPGAPLAHAHTVTVAFAFDHQLIMLNGDIFDQVGLHGLAAQGQPQRCSAHCEAPRADRA